MPDVEIAPLAVKAESATSCPVSTALEARRWAELESDDDRSHRNEASKVCVCPNEDDTDGFLVSGVALVGKKPRVRLKTGSDSKTSDGNPWADNTSDPDASIAPERPKCADTEKGFERAYIDELRHPKLPSRRSEPTRAESTNGREMPNFNETEQGEVRENGAETVAIDEYGMNRVGSSNERRSVAVGRIAGVVSRPRETANASEKHRPGQITVSQKQIAQVAARAFV